MWYEMNDEGDTYAIPDDRRNCRIVGRNIFGHLEVCRVKVLYILHPEAVRIIIMKI
jgi:hypothetical protein